MLSDLLRFRLEDASGKLAKLVDLAVDPSVADYPPVTRVLIRSDDGTCQLPWDGVGADWPRRALRVDDLTASVPAPQEALDRLLLLKRDILDALVLDLEHRHAARANDL